MFNKDRVIYFGSFDNNLFNLLFSGNVLKILTSNNLSQEDKDRARQLCGWFKAWKRKGRPPITQAALIKKLKETVQWDYTTHSFPALINYARMELNEWIISCNDGLFYAETEQEKKDFLEYYESLIGERLRVLNWIKKKLNEEQKANQVGLFTDVEQTTIYGETFQSALTNKLGAKKVEEILTL